MFSKIAKTTIFGPYSMYNAAQLYSIVHVSKTGPQTFSVWFDCVHRSGSLDVIKLLWGTATASIICGYVTN